jgi:hypothetical protein
MENKDLVTFGDLSDAELDLVAAGYRQSGISVNVPTNVAINIGVQIPTALNIATLTYGVTQTNFQILNINQHAGA